MSEAGPTRPRRIVVTNDDGIGARGLRVLEELARGLSDDVWVVAPAHEQSGTAHSVSITQPIRLTRLDEQRYAVVGTPADCVIMACKHLLADAPPDLVLAGVNRGPNLGDDCIYSGTTGAAREATLNGIRAIALSQALTQAEVKHWETSERWAGPVIEELLRLEPPRGVFHNVNLPDVPPERVRGLRVVPHGDRWHTELAVQSRVDGRGVPYYWLALELEPRDFPPATDLSALAEGYITVTPLQFKVNHAESQPALRDALCELAARIEAAAGGG